MDLKLYLAILWRRKWIIILMTVVTMTVTTVVSLLIIPPQYTASATLWIPTTSPKMVRTGNVAGNVFLADRLINTYAALVTSRPVLTKLEKRLDISLAERKSLVDAKFEPQSELLSIMVTDSDPEMAAYIATNLARIVMAQTRRTDTGRDLRASLFAPAIVPDKSSQEEYFPIYIALAFVVGLSGGIGLAVLYDYLDSALYTTEQIESVTGLTTLGEIPTISKKQAITLLNNGNHVGEAFRYLRTSILFDQNTLPPTLLVTSAIPGEGKSTVVANLALAVAQAEQKVIVVDTDLRLPALHKIFDLPNEVGLSSILKQEVDLTEAIQDSNIPGVQVITSGPLPTNPAALLDSPQMNTVIEQLKRQPNLVLLDTPALLAVADAVVLVPTADAVVLVIGRAQVQQEAVQTACQKLTAVKANLVGLVVNRAEQDSNYYHYYSKKSCKNRG